jgi:alpha-galactosidase
MKPLKDGTIAVGMFNRMDTPSPITLHFTDIGLQGSARLRDLWKHQDLGPSTDVFRQTIASHGVMLLKVTK